MVRELVIGESWLLSISSHSPEHSLNLRVWNVWIDMCYLNTSIYVYLDHISTLTYLMKVKCKIGSTDNKFVSSHFTRSLIVKLSELNSTVELNVKFEISIEI